jgi:predicted permease
VFADSLAQDVRYAFRGVRRSPLFAASVALTLGIGLGILCSTFTVVNAYLFKAVNLPNPHELYALSWNTDAQPQPFSLRDFEAMAAGNPVFSRLAAGNTVVASHNGARLIGHLVTRDYFGLLGGPAALGRTLAAGDFDTNADRAVLVLTDEGWRTEFGADPAIVGKEITLSGTRFVVIGVTPGGATLPGDEELSFWAPLSMARAFDAPDPAWSDNASLFIVARRRADVSVEQVRAWFDTWAYQRVPAGTEPAAIHTRVNGLATRIPINRATVMLFSFLLAAFGLVLLVACANVTNMLLARGLARQRELGVRASLGAGRGRIVRQLIVESAVLSLPAAAIGLALTYATAWAFPRVVTSTIPAGAEIAKLMLAPLDPDLRVLAFVLFAASVAAILIGVSPALQLTRVSLIDAVRGQLGPNTRVSRMRSGFVIFQVATCVLFLVGAIALVVQSRRMTSLETGLDYERVVVVRSPSPDLNPAVAAELRSRADVESVAAVWKPPLASPMAVVRVTPSQSVTEQNARFMAVSAEYFSSLGVALRQGRTFSAVEAEQEAAVVVISEATGRTLWPGRDPLGQVLDITPAADSRRYFGHAKVEVIGVVEDTVNGTLLDGVEPTTIYFPTAMASQHASSLLVRMRGDASVAARPIALALEAAHRGVSFGVVPLPQHTGLQLWLFWGFSTAALVPAAIGVLLAFAGTYGVVAFLMTQRTREFGIRMALGASAGNIMRHVVGGTVRTASIAALCGLAASVAMMRALGSIIGTNVSIHTGVYAAGIAVVIAASAVAALIPATRAIRLNPSHALRAE